jgi:hypothetical protein
MSSGGVLDEYRVLKSLEPSRTLRTTPEVISAPLIAQKDIHGLNSRLVVDARAS